MAKQTTREQCSLLHQYWPDNCCLCNSTAELARLREECERLHFQVGHYQQGVEITAERITELRAFVGLVLEYCEKGVPYWYGEDLKTRARKLLKETPCP